jgi:hypothetical protein
MNAIVISHFTVATELYAKGGILTLVAIGYGMRLREALPQKKVDLGRGHCCIECFESNESTALINISPLTRTRLQCVS